VAMGCCYGTSMLPASELQQNPDLTAQHWCCGTSLVLRHVPADPCKAKGSPAETPSITLHTPPAIAPLVDGDSKSELPQPGNHLPPPSPVNSSGGSLTLSVMAVAQPSQPSGVPPPLRLTLRPRTMAPELVRLQFRELTPEDYELLCLLDESVPKNGTAPQSLVARLPAVFARDCGVTKCHVCLAELPPLTRLVQLPCRHAFHPECASRWLTQFNASCPLCKLPIKRADDVNAVAPLSPLCPHKPIGEAQGLAAGWPPPQVLGRVGGRGVAVAAC